MAAKAVQTIRTNETIEKMNCEDYWLRRLSIPFGQTRILYWLRRLSDNSNNQGYCEDENIAKMNNEDCWLRRLRRQMRLGSSRQNGRTAADKQGCARLRSSQQTRPCSSRQTRLRSSRQTGIRSSRQARLCGSQQPRLRSSQQETKLRESARIASSCCSC